MNDLMQCPACGKQTNKYSPSCEHCGATLPRETAPPGGGAPRTAPVAAADRPSATIEERGKALGEALAARSAGFMKKCPFCAEEILPDAVKCRYCGELLKKPGTAARRYAIMLAAAILCAAALAALFLKFGGAGAIMSFSNVNAASDELKADPAKAAYVRKYITLSDVGTLAETDSKYASSADYIAGKVRNAGDRLVIKLKVTVYYLNKRGAVIAEGAVWPVLGNKDRRDSLKAAGSRDFKLPITAVHPAWSRAVRAKVSDIEFLE